MLPRRFTFLLVAAASAACSSGTSTATQDGGAETSPPSHDGGRDGSPADATTDASPDAVADVVTTDGTPEAAPEAGDGALLEGGGHDAADAVAEGGAIDAGASLSDYCTTGVPQICTKLATCNWVGANEVTTCTADAQSWCGVFVTNVASGVASYDASAAAACYAAIASATCGELGDLFSGLGPCASTHPNENSYSGGLQWPNIAGVFVHPSSGVGAACDTNYPCATGYCATTGTAVCATCAAYAAVGQSCATAKCDPTASYCAAGTCAALLPMGASCTLAADCATKVCAGTPKTCTAPGALGAACNAATAPCASPNYCNAGVCAARVQAGGTCTSSSQCAAPLVCLGGTCATEPFHAQALGAPCVASSDCADGTHCSTGGVCVAAVATGAACGTDSDCAVGAFCSLNNGSRTCVVPSGENQPCTGNSYSCQLGLYCLGAGNTCVPGGALGARCDTLFGTCAQGYCPAVAPQATPAYCTAYIANGAACNQGTSQYCASGICDTTSHCAASTCP